MASTAKITLAGVEYTIRKFNIGELERIAETVEGPRHKVPFTIIGIALERAEPKLTGSVHDIETDTDEIQAAMAVVMDLAGLKAKTTGGDKPGDPPVAPLP